MKPNEEHHEQLPPMRRRTLTIIAIVGLVAMAVLFAIGFSIHHSQVRKRESMARESQNRPIVVETVRPKPTQQSFPLTLPADVRPYATTALYARANGYRASWNFDIGDRVKKGDVMATISAPDTDAQLAQAEAALGQAQTSHRLALTTEERFRGLVATHGVTQQQLDQNHSATEQASASVVSARATRDRMKTLVEFEKIVAPYDGVVTARTHDIGALISATETGPGQELFDVAADDVLRVSVSVPQAYARFVQFGQPVSLTFERIFPGHRFHGIVSRSVSTLDPATRTLRTELIFKNDDSAGHIFPGMYGEAIFEIKRDHPVLTIPTGAMLFEPEGKEVAVVEAGDKIHFQKIVPGFDFGTEIEVTSGLKGDERIVANPGEQLKEGIKVSPREKNEAGNDKKTRSAGGAE